MKRIIIPAGTVSGKKDYILEIPIDSNDQDENAIYILDDKSSRGSMKSLSDYFYDNESRSQLNQEYMKQYLYQEEHSPKMYQNHSSNELRQPYPSNYMMKQEFNNRNYQQVESTNNPDFSQTSKYQYYKSLGFTDSELHKLLARKGDQRRMGQVPSQRKQMRFNRLGVSDFTSLGDDQSSYQYQYDSFAKPVSAAIGNTNVNAYANMTVNGSYSDIPYTASTSFDRSQGYYEDYPVRKQSAVPTTEARMYKQYQTPVRTPATASKSNTTRMNQSYTIQSNSSTQPSNTQQMQNAYYQQRYYAKTVPSAKSPIQSKTGITQNTVQSQAKPNNSESYETTSRTISPDDSVIPLSNSENYQKPPYNFLRQISNPQKRIYRTLPGTSVVSNVPSIRIRNQVVS